MQSNIFYVHPSPLDQRRGRIVFAGIDAPCALGRSGVVVDKREGDGATPRAVLRPIAVHWRRDRLRRPPASLPLKPIRPSDGWCDDARHRRYNQPVRLPFPASHEAMHRADHLYDIVIDLDWNRRPAVAGRGSAIFLHLARPGYLPTEGCIAVSPKTMRLILSRLTRRSRFIVRPR